jgi:hypothetical protein
MFDLSSFTYLYSIKLKGGLLYAVHLLEALFLNTCWFLSNFSGSLYQDDPIHIAPHDASDNNLRLFNLCL